MSATKAGWFALVLATLASSELSCQGRHDGRSTLACEGAGIVSSRIDSRRDRSEVAVEIVQSGCADCAAATRLGAPPGSACSAASVCGEACCECPDSSPSTYYRARICDSGKCGMASALCAEARAAIWPDICAKAR